jgi:hypothetical protein
MTARFPETLDLARRDASASMSARRLAIAQVSEEINAGAARPWAKPYADSKAAILSSSVAVAKSSKRSRQLVCGSKSCQA